ncbi:DUF6551 family protein [Tsuneonella sp. HG094]
MSRPATTRLKVNPPLGRMPVLQFAMPGELAIDAAYQRSIAASESQALIRRIAQHWNWDLCQPLVVSRRVIPASSTEGVGEREQLYVIDGQHRLEAAKLRGDIAQLPCVIGSYACAADEAASFVHLNQQRRALNAMDLFRAALASEDPTASAIVGALTDASLSLAPHSNHTAWKPGMVSNIGGIQREWRRWGETVCRAALRVLGSAFPGEVLQYAGTIFPGIVAACRAGDDETQLIAKLGEHGQKALRRDIAMARAVDATLGLSGASAFVVRALVAGKPLVPQAKGKVVDIRVHTAVPAATAPATDALITFRGTRWCDQCDMKVSHAEAIGCKSRWCTLRKLG